MIGNDIVDLGDPRALGKSRDSRFMNRVFTTNERRAIVGSIKPDVILWSLWAAKEASYKAVCKIDPDVSSSPRRYEIELFPSLELLPKRGIAHTPCGRVAIRFFVKSDSLHCLGVTDKSNMNSIVWDVRKIDLGHSSPECQSKIARKMVKNRASRFLYESPEVLEIVRTKGHRGLGPPVLYVRKAKAAIDISMSHDGRFVACALQDIRGGESKN